MWRIARGSVQRLRTVAADRWLLVGFVLVLLLFVVMLFILPGSVGRGGR
jgi:hypothetical protein